MKQVGIKIEGKGRFEYFTSAYRVEERLLELRLQLKEGDAIEIKCGREYHYIDYDEDAHQDENIFCYMYEINRVMYYVKLRLGSHS